MSSLGCPVNILYPHLSASDGGGWVGGVGVIFSRLVRGAGGIVKWLVELRGGGAYNSAASTPHPSGANINKIIYVCIRGGGR